MADNQDLTRTMERIRKLMSVAERDTTNEGEATNALSLAQQLADAYNIDIAGIKTSKPGERADDVFPGGLYPYQRKLYQAIAELNHCVYWSRKGLQRGEKYKHRLLGSKVNVMLVRQMTEYLQGTVETITRKDYCGGIPQEFFRKDAHLFREGMVDRIVDRITVKQAEEERERKRKADEQAAQSGNTANALVTLDDVRERERAANYDYQHGEGAWQAIIDARNERARQAEAAAAKYEQWKKDHPVEYAEEVAKAAVANAKWAREYEKQKQRSRRKEPPAPRPSRQDEKYYSRAYNAGAQAGEKVGLDKQVEGSTVKGLIE